MKIKKILIKALTKEIKRLKRESRQQSEIYNDICNCFYEQPIPNEELESTIRKQEQQIKTLHEELRLTADTLTASLNAAKAESIAWEAEAKRLQSIMSR